MTEKELQEGKRLNEEIKEHERLAEKFRNAYQRHPRRLRKPSFRGLGKEKEALWFFQGIEFEFRTEIPLDKELTDVIADYYEKKIEKLKEEFSLLGKG